MNAQPLCDRAMALACAPCRPPRRPRVVGLVTILSSSLALIDGSVVNVGLPAIGRDLGAGASELQWVVNAYLLPLSALLLLGGALGDRFGQGRVLMSGVGIFALGSAGCALAQGLEPLLLARCIQGIGAALLLPSSLAVLGQAFSGPARSRMVGIWAATGSMGAAIGPVFGGWLIDQVGWRAIFLINLPLAAIAIGLAFWAVRDIRAESGNAALDVRGALLATAGLAGLTWGLTEGAGPRGWSVPAIVAVVAGAVLAAAFVKTEQHLGDKAMVPLALFGSRPLIGLNLSTLALYGALSGFLLLLPYVLIVAGGYTAAAAGAALLPLPLVLSVASPIAGGAAGRFGARGLLIAGPLVMAAGLLFTTLVPVTGNYWSNVLPAVAIVALGMACAAAPLTSAVLGSVDASRTGSASGLNSAAARVGGLVATALLGVVLTGKGPALVQDFRAAAAIGAAAALAAAACAAFLYRDPPPSGEAAAEITSGGS